MSRTVEEIELREKGLHKKVQLRTLMGVVPRLKSVILSYQLQQFKILRNVLYQADFQGLTEVDNLTLNDLYFHFIL